MRRTPWEKRFFASTRGRILALLRRGGRTVDELAGALDRTPNAIRVQIAALERDGLVHNAGVKDGNSGTRGVGKPAYVYKLTEQAERLFPKAFEVALRGVLDAMSEQIPPEQAEQILRSAGHSIGRRYAGQAATGNGAQPIDLRSRLERAVAVLNDLGGLVELEESDRTTSLCGYICPLSDVSVSHPMVCRMTETLLSDLVGTPVRERCERNEHLWCRFEVDTSAE